jgi:hypothetical protein
LLRLNTETHHPFADRLIEYLVNNAIVSTTDEIPQNIKRAQKALAENQHKNNYEIAFRGI